jgi:hypothetical protein
MYQNALTRIVSQLMRKGIDDLLTRIAARGGQVDLPDAQRAKRSSIVVHALVWVPKIDYKSEIDYRLEAFDMFGDNAEEYSLIHLHQLVF